MALEKMAQIQGEGRRNGLTPDDIPNGHISWEEHLMAWQTWAHKRREPVSAEQIHREGGFSYRQVADLLGHNPVTWEVAEQKYSMFQLAPQDAPPDLTEFKVVEPPAPRSHIRNGASEQPIHELEDDAPEGLFFFDFALGAHCDRCLRKMEIWLSHWVEMGETEGEHG